MDRVLFGRVVEEALGQYNHCKIVIGFSGDSSEIQFEILDLNANPLCAFNLKTTNKKIAAFYLPRREYTIGQFIRRGFNTRKIGLYIKECDRDALILPDIILAGCNKIRLLFLTDKKVISFDLDQTKKQCQMDAQVRINHPLLPAAKVYQIKANFVEEELLNRPKRAYSYLTHPSIALKALEAMLPAIKKSLCTQKAKDLDLCKTKRRLYKLISQYNVTGDLLYAVCHGQIYKVDHVFFTGDGTLKLGDWGSGGDSNINGLSYVYFDVVSSIKWTVFQRRKGVDIYFYIKYLNSFLDFAKDMAVQLGFASRWKYNFLCALALCQDEEGPFSESNPIYRAFLRKVALW